MAAWFVRSTGKKNKRVYFQLCQTVPWPFRSKYSGQRHWLFASQEISSKSKLHESVQNFRSREPYIVRKPDFRLNLYTGSPLWGLWEALITTEAWENPMWPCKTFPRFVLGFHISRWNSFDSRGSICSFSSFLITGSGTFTHQAAIFLLYSTASQSNGEGSNLCKPCPLCTQAPQQNILFWLKCKN